MIAVSGFDARHNQNTHLGGNVRTARELDPNTYVSVLYDSVQFGIYFAQDVISGEHTVVIRTKRGVEALDAFYDRVGTFPLNNFLNDGVL